MAVARTMMPLASVNAWRISASLGTFLSITPQLLKRGWGRALRRQTGGRATRMRSLGLEELGEWRGILGGDEDQRDGGGRADLRGDALGERQLRGGSLGAHEDVRGRAVVV